ncbi:hypothetical protein ONZ45_g6753 [Pleurotus djamor]|nr:hypothetical protein ONZ45_g6753 [Pleurotus djamor]
MATPPLLRLDDTLGAAFVGVICAAVLHGVSLVQAWYYATHQNDGWLIKSLVTFVMIFDTIHQALISHTVYSYLVTNYGNPQQLGYLVWSLLVEVLFNGFTAFLVQSFLTMRVWRLSGRNLWLTIPVCALVLGEFACVIAFTAKSLHLKTYIELASLKELSITVNALAAAGDVLIAVILCTLLHRSRTGFQRSDTMINKLIIFAVNTGVLTSLCAVASLISIVVAGNTFLYIAFFFCIGRLYSNSLLATLNARDKIRAASGGVQSTSEHLSFRETPMSPRSLKTTISRLGMRPAQTSISIKIDTTKEFASDNLGNPVGRKSVCDPDISDDLESGIEMARVIKVDRECVSSSDVSTSSKASFTCREEDNQNPEEA